MGNSVTQSRFTRAGLTSTSEASIYPRPLPRVFDPAVADAIDTLEVVYKVVERCNINCTYCYYYNMGDNSALERPAVAAQEEITALARWVADGCRDQKIPRASIAVHGGEPMLMGASRFGEMCATFRETIGDVAETSFSIQTNGTVLSDAWMRVFAEYGVAIGVSIDGDQSAHDRYRLDRRKRSTFARTERHLHELVEWADAIGRERPSTISVISRHNNYRAIYRYLRTLGIERMSFLLPDRNADDPISSDQATVAAYGRALAEIFEEWLTEDDPKVVVRFINDVLRFFSANPRRDLSFIVNGKKKKSHQIIVARSDGTVAIDDSLIPALDWYSTTPAYSIHDATLGEFLSDPVFRAMEAEGQRLPTACRECSWRGICQGGDLENRYSAERGFDNPSVYCAAYQAFYTRMCELLLAGGYPEDLFKQRLSESLPK